MGKSSAQTVGFWYLPAFHAGLGIGPLDAFLEFRGGDKTAWAGELTTSGTIYINAPNLWGGEKDQGGIVGPVDVMFGEAGQQPNAYLTSVFGDQQPAWRGLATLVFKGGKYGAMNPYPQKASYKIRKIKKGWDGDNCWYPEKAEVQMTQGETALSLIEIDDLWKYKTEVAGSSADYSAWTYDDSTWSEGSGGFGNYGPGFSTPPANTIVFGGTVPTTAHNVIWIRRTFEGVPNGAQMQIDVWHDDGAQLFINGAEVELADIDFFHARAIIPAFNLSSSNSMALRVEDSLGGGNNTYIYAGVSMTATWAGLGAMNPAHILYYSLTQADMGREPVANINSASFLAAADWFHSHGFGLCTSYDPSAESVEEFQQRICRVAGCSLTRSLIDGQWYLDIANGEYTLASLPILTDDDILDFEEQPTLLDSAVNSVSVKYFDPQLKEAIVTPPVQAPALISDFGTNHLTIEYLEIPTGALATRVAQRELLARVTPLRGFPLKTTRKPYGWRPSTYFRLQCPKRGITDMVCIFSEKSSGQLRSGAMTISATQDVYSMPNATFVEVEPGVDTSPSQVAQPVAVQQAFEAPYIEIVQRFSRADLNALPADVGYLLTVASPAAESRDYTIMAKPVAATDYEEVGNGMWCPTALIVEGDVLEDAPPATSFTFVSGKRLAEVAIGSAAMWGTELCRVDALDVDAGTIALGRGCGDTVPVPHSANTRIWFYDDAAGYDAVTEYTDGEAINVKLLTNTGTQQLSIGAAVAMTVEFDQRIDRPYPPGAVKINGDDYPTQVVGSAVVTWAHRDRVTQSDQLVDASMASIGPEAGTTYTIETYNDSTNALIAAQTGITGTTATVAPASMTLNTRLELFSIRGGVESWQRNVIRFQTGFEITGANPLGGANNETYSTQLQANGGVAPYTWSIASGALPTGLALDGSTSSTVTITGVPNATAGYYTVQLQAQDSNGVVGTRSITIGIGNIVSLHHFDNNNTDQTGRTWSSNNTFSNTQYVFGGYSADCSSNHGLFGCSNPAQLVLGTGDFTIEARIRVASLPGPTYFKSIVGNWASNSGWCFWLTPNSAPGGLRFHCNNGGGLSTPNNVVTAGVWHHVAVTRKGGTLYIFVDGVLKASGAVPDNITRNDSPVIGGNNAGLNDNYGYAANYLDEFRMTLGVARYTENFTVPAAASNFPVVP